VNGFEVTYSDLAALDSKARADAPARSWGLNLTGTNDTETLLWVNAINMQSEVCEFYVRQCVDCQPYLFYTGTSRGS
jgi:hypothetical protein